MNILKTKPLSNVTIKEATSVILAARQLIVVGRSDIANQVLRFVTDPQQALNTYIQPRHKKSRENIPA